MNDKKIAIMTWYTYNNYGSVLQAYSLRKAIQALNYETVNLINYLPKSQKSSLREKLNIINVKERLLLRTKNVKTNITERNVKFDKFRKEQISITQKCNDATELFLLNEQYDKFICGSDQIWAPTVFDENYFLSFVKDNCKKIAYAPSIGLPVIENKYIKKNIKELVNRFNNLSIREEQGKEILENITDKEIQVVLDPTLLLNKKDWNDNFKLEDKQKGYVLFYCLGRNKKYYKLAKKISKKLGKELIVIPGTVFDYLKREINNASPTEFLKLIYNADVVLTDSFHGTIFSINFNIPFITFKRFKDNKLSQNSRIYSILKKVNLQERIYNNNLDYFLKNIDIDFSEANEILEKERASSINFLTKALENENETINTEKITNLCTGCGMCAAICPRDAINIKLNGKGFYSYEIDQEKCIHCNMCKKVCGQLNTETNEIQKMKMYSAYSLDEDVLKESSSGGIAYELSSYCLKNNIPVIGCTYNLNEQRAEHIKVTKKEELKKLSGSKYIQSYTLEAFSQLNQLQNGLVIGTPCQISSVDRYLKSINKREKFILVDLICHGVPTYHLWNKYIQQFNNVSQVKFRDKKYNWRSMTISINSKHHEKENKSLFYHFFNLGNIYNKSCYHCKYRKKTAADIKIGDYWGKKFKNNKKGVSMVIVNTKNGEKILEELKKEKRIQLDVQPIDDYFKIQQTENIAIPIMYEQTIAELENENINLKKLSQKYCKEELMDNKIKNTIFNVYNKIKRK